MNDLLCLDSVAKSFGGVVALSNVDLRARAAEVHAVLGENGAGKSTCIKLLAGALTPDSGAVSFHGESVTFASPHAAVAAGIASVFQEISLVPDLTVAQNVFFGREPRTLLRTANMRAMNVQTQRLFDDLQVHDIAPTRYVRDLTVGERQTVEIAKAVARNPRVLILDEATSALSPHQTAWLLKLARRLADAGALVIFISHRMREVREIADRVTVLRNGTSVGTYETSSLSDDDIVALMLGRRAGHLYPDPAPPPTEHVLLEVNDLDDGHRLQGIDLTLRAGEIVGVGGLQGHGQVELFDVLAGAKRAKGTIKVDGRVTTYRSVRQALNTGIGVALVPEDRKTQGLLLGKSVRENLTLTALSTLSRWGLINKRREEQLAAEDIQRFNIALSSPDQTAGSLSGGNQQKIVIAKALRTNAKVLLLFDLTRGVDVGTKADIFALMRQLASDGFALLFFSTDNEELINMCHRVAVLNYGKVARVIDRDDLTDEAILGASMMVQERLQ